MFSEYQRDHPELEKLLESVLRAAENGTLGPEHRAWLTTANLKYKLCFGPDDPLNPKGSVWKTIVGTAAEYRHLDQIPAEALAPLAEEPLDTYGTTVLHAAAAAGCLNQFPESRLNRKNLFQNLDSLGQSPALLAIRNSSFKQIPKNLWKAAYLAQPMLRGKTIFHSAAEEGFLENIPKRLLTVRTMSLQNHWGTTPLHLAAANGHLWQVPMHAYSLQSLKIRDYAGNTPLHLAVEFAGVPSGMLCDETLMQVNAQGDTVLHILWRDGNPAAVDPEFYTPEILALEGRDGLTILDHAAIREEINLVPSECLRAAEMLRVEREIEAERSVWDDN